MIRTTTSAEGKEATRPLTGTPLKPLRASPLSLGRHKEDEREELREVEVRAPRGISNLLERRQKPQIPDVRPGKASSLQSFMYKYFLN